MTERTPPIPDGLMVAITQSVQGLLPESADLFIVCAVPQPNTADTFVSMTGTMQPQQALAHLLGNLCMTAEREGSKPDTAALIADLREVLERHGIQPWAPRPSIRH